MSVIDVETFNSNFTVVVSRYEVYPVESPTSYCVGFTVSANSAPSNTTYQDTRVSLADAEGKTSGQITALAWDSVKNSLYAWATSVYNRPAVLGSVYVPN